MKKLLAVMLCVIFALTCIIPVSAASPSHMSYNGVVLPNINGLINSAYPKAFIYKYNSTTYDLVICKGDVIISTSTENYDKVFSVTDYEVYAIKPAEGTISKVNSGYKDPICSYDKVIWTNCTIKRDGVIVFTATDPVIPICTEVDCPATDLNKDNICDDCGFEFETPRDYTVYKTYGKVTLPDIETVWIDKTTYPAMAIYQNTTTGEYHLLFGNSYVKDYVYNEELFENDDLCYFKLGENYYHYKLVDKVWELVENGSNSVVCRTASNNIIWTTQPIYSDESHNALFFHRASPLVNSLTVKTGQGVMTQTLMILPIGIACLIGYLGLRKGLKILAGILSKA